MGGEIQGLDRAAADSLIGGSAADWIVFNTLGSTATRDKATLDGQDFSQQDD